MHRRSRRIAIATCDRYPELVPDDRLAFPFLHAAGLAPEGAIWSDPAVRWREYEAVVLRTTWDYYQRIDEFRSWLARLERDGVRVLNPLAVVRANLDKVYLRDLEARGVATVPTFWMDRGDQRTAAEILSTAPWDDAAEVVVKPSVSAGAYRTKRTTLGALRRDDAFVAELLQDAHGLVQPFLPEFVEPGELSLLYFGDEFSHAVVKRPKAGDFRVQWTHGGSHRRTAVTPAVRGEAERVRAILDETVGAGRLYTRIDGVVSQGRFLLVEVELVEPYLFLGEDPDAPERFALALVRALGPVD
jgi:glutathione synthase/RimK-type ligase-like ATP-grasp enzyme